MKNVLQRFWFVGCSLILVSWSCDAWMPSTIRSTVPSRAPPRLTTSTLYANKEGGGFFDFLNPYESKIPAELRDEIYKAEGNTPAAKDRSQRVALYTLIAFVGIMSAFFNGFLSEIRANGPDGNGVDLVEAGFGWVINNPFSSFLFTNKIGGGICLLGGAGAGLMAEAELDTKRINAEKIYEELERRRQAKDKKSSSKNSSSSKKRRPGKESKRLVALSEVMAEENAAVKEETTTVGPEDEPTKAAATEHEGEKKSKDNEGLFGSIKSLYDKADTMAASQALLLNKKLEEAGVVEKITDDTGLKVIGREEAAKKKQEKEQKNKQ